jgi:hypothetical protein
MKPSSVVIPAAVLASLALLPPTVFGADSKGLRPRTNHTQYPVTVFNESVAVACERVSPAHVRKQFGADLDARFLVVEVGIFPREKSTIHIKPDEFVLRVKADETSIKPYAAKQIAAADAVVTSEVSLHNLPEGPTAKPVAGYLFFPLEQKIENDRAYELEYKGQSGWMILPLQMAAERANVKLIRSGAR